MDFSRRGATLQKDRHKNREINYKNNCYGIMKQNSFSGLEI